MKKTVFIPLLVILIFSIFWTLKFSKNIFLPTDVIFAEKSYSTSQYVIGDLAEEKIKDSTVYTYAGYRYILGEDPTKINFEHPPFGKYILGLSWFLFGNMTVINLLLYIFCLGLFWRISRLTIKNLYFRIGALVLLCSSSLLPFYVFRSMLDIQLLFYTLLFFYSLFFVKDKNKSLVILGLSLGAYLSTKYFFPSIFSLLFILFLVSYTRKNLLFAFKAFFIALIFYLFSYLRYFFSNPNPIDFIKFEWFRFRWWTGDRSMPKFLILGTIFFGRFKGWWADNIYEKASNWSLLLPVSMISWLSSFFVIPKKINFKSMSTLYSILLLLIYLFGAAASERYLIQLLPFWILNFVFMIEYFYIKISKKKI